jgi:hypothetical protein
MIVLILFGIFLFAFPYYFSRKMLTEDLYRKSFSVGLRLFLLTIFTYCSYRGICLISYYFTEIDFNFKTFAIIGVIASHLFNVGEKLKNEISQKKKKNTPSN